LKKTREQILWHQKDFHLAVRLWDLKQAGVTSLDGGFLSLDSLFTPGDLCPSILGIPRVSHKRVKFAVQCLFELVGQYKALSVPLFQSPGIETLLQTQELPFSPLELNPRHFSWKTAGAIKSSSAGRPFGELRP
jgi:hypothetical protein